MFVSMRSDIYEVPICMELHYWPEPMKDVRCHVREGFDGSFKFQIIGVEHCV
jgi:hypothetical protein